MLSRAAILDFEDPLCRILAEITAEIKLGSVPEMEVSHPFDILVGAVRNIDLPCVDELGKIVLIGLPPQFLDLLIYLGGMRLESVGQWMVVCCGVWC